MKDYLDSLQRLEQYPATGIAPGHGNLIPEPGKVIDTLRRHRLMREQKVLSAMKKIGPGNILDLLPVVYDDVEPKLHFYARFSLWAHLLKLERTGIHGCSLNNVRRRSIPNLPDRILHPDGCAAQCRRALI